ncbi:MAG: hypothetical protein HYU66_10040 [Armatimonadetes bacterium]|nr:hypothetical protein [Armatimonadota bacterium]
MPFVALAALLAVAPPWWDDYPTTIQGSDSAAVAAVGADSALCGLADDPGWGIHGDRTRSLWLTPLVQPLRDKGVKLLTWVETFGTIEAYVASFTRLPDGRLRGFDNDPATPRPIHNHWSWHVWKPTPGEEVHWLGPVAYYDDEPWVRPWTRTHPRYGAPPFTYPDGRAATGYADPADPGTARLFDAGGSKSILGRPTLDYEFNAKVNQLDPRTGKPAGPTDHLIPIAGPDGTRYSSLVGVGKDYACPHWIEYAAASARYLADCGVDGLWADNFSAWDGFGNPPIRVAFGEWSVARFREHLRRHFAPAQLTAMGVEDPATFDIREYLRRVLRERFGGVDTDLSHAAWRDPRWLDDPLWREFLVFKRDSGRAALRAFHDAYHKAAREKGIRDFMIQGNDIPIYSLGFPRPECLEMVSTEFSPGWNLFTGPRGQGLPPHGRIGAVIKAARVHAKSRFVHVWYYLQGPYEKYRGNPAVGRLIAYELLAQHAFIQAYPSNPDVAGTNVSHAEVFRFAHAAKATWGDRQPYARIGLLYSPDTRLASITPGGMADFAAQPHHFDLLGWGTLLSELHAQYTVVPEWKLDRATLGGLDVLIVPSVEVLDDRAVAQVVRPWVRAGGRLVLSGKVGLRDPRRSFARYAGTDPALAALVAEGKVLRLPAIGFDYYQTEPAKRDPSTIEPAVRELVRGPGLVTGDLPREVEASVFTSPSRAMVCVDLANLDMDVDRDAVPQAHTVTLRLRLPGRPAGKLGARVLAPDAEPAAVPVRVENGELVVGPVEVRWYASVGVAGWRVRWRRIPSQPLQTPVTRRRPAPRMGDGTVCYSPACPCAARRARRAPVSCRSGCTAVVPRRDGRRAGRAECRRAVRGAGGRPERPIRRTPPSTAVGWRTRSAAIQHSAKTRSASSSTNAAVPTDSPATGCTLARSSANSGAST